jgi:hypothetical protein
MVLEITVNNSAAETNIPIWIPWDEVDLDHITAVVTTIIDTTGAMEVDFELDAAGGTELMTISAAAAAAVGTEYDATVTTKAACNNLGRNQSARDRIVIEVDGSATGTGQLHIRMFFVAAGQGKNR